MTTSNEESEYLGDWPVGDQAPDHSDDPPTNFAVIPGYLCKWETDPADVFRISEAADDQTNGFPFVLPEGLIQPERIPPVGTFTKVMGYIEGPIPTDNGGLGVTVVAQSFGRLNARDGAQAFNIMDIGTPRLKAKELQNYAQLLDLRDKRTHVVLSGSVVRYELQSKNLYIWIQEAGRSNDNPIPVCYTPSDMRIAVQYAKEALALRAVARVTVNGWFKMKSSRMVIEIRSPQYGVQQIYA